MVKTNFLLLLSFLVTIGCSVQSRKDQSDFRNLFAQKQFIKAETFLKTSVIKTDEENKLLYMMELGTLYFYQGFYKKAANVFVDANTLVDKLYTKSIKEALASSILNDNSKTFYGSIFERSQLYQYQAMSFYQLAKRGSFYKETLKDGVKTKTLVNLSKNQIRTNYDRVRSTLIAWDSFFQEMNRIKGIKTFLKHDLMAKQIAAKLHESLGTKRDRSIALQLYKDAFDIFKEMGPTLKVFNEKYKEYNAELKDVYNKKLEKSKMKAKKLTSSYQDLKDELIYKIIYLTKKVRSSDYQKIVRKYKPSKEIKNRLRKKSLNNVSFLIEKGLISQLEGKDFSYNLRSAIDGIKSPTTRALVNGIGVPVLTYFALGPLGLGYATHYSNNVTVYSRHGAGEILTKEVGIEFELPYAKASNENTNNYLRIFKGKKQVLEKQLTYLSSLSDISFINAQEMIENSFTKRATRVGVKYVTAIIAAYGTYQKMKDAGGELFAKPAAMAQFLISQKAIKQTEKADARHWSTLPGSHLNLELNLPNGQYRVEYIERNSDNTQLLRSVNLGEVDILNQKNQSLFSYRTF
ncbi:MAG: hypothetical protein ACJAS4_002933 [Bacteriovoracaceae bacterium]